MISIYACEFEGYQYIMHLNASTKIPQTDSVGIQLPLIPNPQFSPARPISSSLSVLSIPLLLPHIPHLRIVPRHLWSHPCHLLSHSSHAHAHAHHTLRLTLHHHTCLLWHHTRLLRHDITLWRTVVSSCQWAQGVVFVCDTISLILPSKSAR